MNGLIIEITEHEMIDDEEAARLRRAAALAAP
jgi:hypothetical protein